MGDLIYVLFFAALVIVGNILASRFLGVERRDAAELLKGTYRRRLRGDRLCADVGGYDVEMSFPSRASDSPVTIRIDTRGDIPQTVRIEPAPRFNLLSGEANLFVEPDALYATSGDPSMLAAMLTPQVRYAIMSRGRDLSVRDGLLEVKLPDPGPHQEIVASIKELVALARMLRVDRENLGVQLYRAFQDEVETGPRRLIYRELLDHARPDLKATVFVDGIEHPDPKIRCMALGAGWPEHRARALETFRNRSEEDEVRAAALRACSAAPSVDELVGELKSADVALCIAIIETLGARGDSIHEPLLLSALALGDEGVPLAAVNALASIGTINAVARLHEHARGPLEQAALAAIQAIQTRAGNAGAGHLSLAPPADGAGALSLSEGPGAVSLPHDEPGP